MRTSSVTSQSSLLAILLLILTVAVAFVRQSIAPYAAELAESEFMPRWGEATIAAVIFVITGIIVGRTATKMGAFNGFCTLPISLYGIIACGILLSPYALTAAASSALSALGTMLLLRALGEFGNKNVVFFASMLFGTAAVVFAPCAMLVALLAVAILLFPLNIRQSIIAIVGWLIPIFAASYITWYAGGEFSSVARNIIDALLPNNVSFAIESFPIVALIIVCIVTILVATGLLLFRANRYSVLVRVRKAMQAEVWFMAIVAATAIATGNIVTMLPIIAIPVSIIAAFALDKMPSRPAVVLYWMLLICFVIHLFVY